MKVWVYGLICILCIGCRASEPQTPTGEAIQIVDSLGRTVVLPRRPQRIVSLAASNTEILYELGVGNEVVGVTEFCTFPPEAAQKPHVGGFAPQSYSLESIMALRPDLVLAAGSFHQPVIDSIDKLGIRVAAFDASNFAEVYQNIEKIGLLTGRSESAQLITAKMEQRLQSIQQHIDTMPKRTVLYLVSEEPLMTVGSKTVISEAINRAGGTNIFADVVGQYPRISDEELIRRKPEVVIYPSLGHDSRTEPPKILTQLLSEPRPELHAFDADLLTRQTPRLIDAVEQLAEILHPRR